MAPVPAEPTTSSLRHSETPRPHALLSPEFRNMIPIPLFVSNGSRRDRDTLSVASPTLVSSFRWWLTARGVRTHPASLPPAHLPAARRKLGGFGAGVAKIVILAGRADGHTHDHNQAGIYVITVLGPRISSGVTSPPVQWEIAARITAPSSVRGSPRSRRYWSCLE